MFHGTSLTSVWKPTKAQFEPYDLCMNGSSHKQKICHKIRVLRSNSDFSNNRKTSKKRNVKSEDNWYDWIINLIIHHFFCLTFVPLFVFRNGRRVPIIKWWSTLSTCDYNLQKSRNVNSAMTKLKKCSFPWNSWEELNHVTWCSTFTSSFISSFLFDLKSKKQSVI